MKTDWKSELNSAKRLSQNKRTSRRISHAHATLNHATQFLQQERCIQLRQDGPGSNDQAIIWQIYKPRFRPSFGAYRFRRRLGIPALLKALILFLFHLTRGWKTLAGDCRLDVGHFKRLAAGQPPKNDRY
ncbi:hypothetical protein I7I51_02300 [Histoplasma capsulatum]|uniref:Uncharacterized protein n=1 Tax=Ajellomyces capsulatus TaxID=5037 RepID=A0A8A1MDH7_AJECA|nr:predicted protein [Histoplasma mississippiense (nom. inval.)]EDN09683.1 predicted protein [Histoplasma mississippiense (nom. inval.)]QSS62562.1 hypothetical protein I7I51_02300 [Histoplasma capsulatum]